MNTALTALGTACLIVWAGLWGYLIALQKRVDRLEEDSVLGIQDSGSGIQDSAKSSSDGH